MYVPVISAAVYLAKSARAVQDAVYILREEENNELDNVQEIKSWTLESKDRREQQSALLLLIIIPAVMMHLRVAGRLDLCVLCCSVRVPVTSHHLQLIISHTTSISNFPPVTSSALLAVAPVSRTLSITPSLTYTHCRTAHRSFLR